MIHKDFECEFYFIRHGESTSNATPGFAAGIDFDSPLTPKGYEQANLLGQKLKREGITFDRIYCSTLQRTAQTARTMLEAMGEGDRHVPQVDAVKEQQIPGWRGVPTDEVMTAEMIAYMRGKGAHFVPPEGESNRMVERRISSWLEDEIVYNQELVTQEQSLRVAVVGHGQATRCLLHYIMSFDDMFMNRIRLDNTSICRFLFNHEGWHALVINDTTHLTLANVEGESAVTP